MRGNRDILKGFLVCLALLCIIGAGRYKFQVTKVYQSEGDTPQFFSITCSSTAWTTVAAADITRRASLIQSLATNSFNICIATMTASGSGCDDAAPSIELLPGASFTDHTEAALNCRSRTGSSGEIIKGQSPRDTGDVGDR